MRKILTLISTLPLYLYPLKFAFADTPIKPCPTAGFGAVACNWQAEKFGSLVGTFIEAIFVIAIVVALGYLIYGAIRWIISQGDKAKVTDARNHIIAAIIGLVIVFLSYFIINIVIGIFFPDKNLTNLSLPSLQ